MLLLGLLAHGEERFVLLPVIILTIVGVDTIAEYTGRWRTTVLTVVATMAALSAVANSQVVARHQLAAVTAERTSLVEVARRLSTCHRCLVVTSYQPEIGWYSGCATTSYARAARSPLPEDRMVHVVTFQRGAAQPAAAVLRRLVDRPGAHAVVLPTTGALGRARVVTLRDPAPEVDGATP